MECTICAACSTKVGTREFGANASSIRLIQGAPVCEAGWARRPRQGGYGTPPCAAIFLSVPSAKKAIHWLSCEVSVAKSLPTNHISTANHASIIPTLGQT
jgi:hypothetical protein